MKPRVTVIDYGMGNLLSVSRALEHCGADVAVESAATAIERAERLVLPGVGAFGDGMAELRQRDLVEPIRRFVGSGRPLLGICLGMQMLLDGSDEFGASEGLGLIKGWVRKLPAQAGLKLPHVGWSPLQVPDGSSWRESLLSGITPGQEMYFVHSYFSDPEAAADRCALTPYGDFLFCSVVSHRNVTGCQFHPEKSGPAGLRIIDTFLR